MTQKVWTIVLLITGTITCMICLQFCKFQKIHTIFQLINMDGCDEEVPDFDYYSKIFVKMETNRQNSSGVNVKVFNLSSPLMPNKVYDQVRCRKSA
jgi:hypothetical protein